MRWSGGGDVERPRSTKEHEPPTRARLRCPRGAEERGHADEADAARARSAHEALPLSAFVRGLTGLSVFFVCPQVSLFVSCKDSKVTLPFLRRLPERPARQPTAAQSKPVADLSNRGGPGVAYLDF